VDAGPLRDLLIAALGVVTGALSGAFGVGGAVISQPGIRALGVPALVAVGTTLPSIFPSAVSGALRYRSEGLIDRTAVVWTVPVGLATSAIGAQLSDVVPGDGHVLMLGTAALLAVTAYRTARGGASAGAHEEPVPRTPNRSSLVGVGAAAGLLSGLLGIGGGVLMVPGFTTLAGLSLRSSIATSLVCVAAFAVPGTISHALLDHIDWRVALLLTVAVIPGARLGAAFTLRASDRRLRRTVGIFLGAVAVLYAGGELAALLS